MYLLLISLFHDNGNNADNSNNCNTDHNGNRLHTSTSPLSFLYKYGLLACDDSIFDFLVAGDYGFLYFNEAQPVFWLGFEDILTTYEFFATTSVELFCIYK